MRRSRWRLLFTFAVNVRVSCIVFVGIVAVTVQFVNNVVVTVIACAVTFVVVIVVVVAAVTVVTQLGGVRRASEVCVDVTCVFLKAFFKVVTTTATEPPIVFGIVHPHHTTHTHTQNAHDTPDQRGRRTSHVQTQTTGTHASNTKARANEHTSVL